MEKIGNVRLHWWLEQRNAFPHQMSGFERRRAAVDCVFDLMVCVEHEHSQGRIAIAIFQNIKGAYDTLSHALVLEGFFFDRSANLCV